MINYLKHSDNVEKLMRNAQKLEIMSVIQGPKIGLANPATNFSIWYHPAYFKRVILISPRSNYFNCDKTMFFPDETATLPKLTYFNRLLQLA